VDTKKYYKYLHAEQLPLFNKVWYLQTEKLLSTRSNVTLNSSHTSGLYMNNKQQKRLRSLIAIILSSAAVVLVTTAAGYADTTATMKAPATKVILSGKTAITDKSVDKSNQVDSPIPADGESTADVPTYSKDPLEGFNRAMFTFNDKLDIYLFKPIATFYNTIMPKPLNQGIHNFFNNLGEVPTIVNDLLQFNFYQMTNDFWRLGINTTIGIGGLFDIATRMYLPYFQNDFGLTLAVWGYEDSSYLVLPFLGSNTIRDGVFGIPVDYFEFSVYPYVQPQSRRYQLLGLFFIDHRANLLQFEPVLEEAAIDKYVFMRNAYMQHRAFQIEQVKHLGYANRNKEIPVAKTSMPE